MPAFSTLLFMILLLVISSCSPEGEPPADKVFSNVMGVNDIALELYKPKNRHGVFSISRANCAGFRSVQYNGDTYYNMGAGATLMVRGIIEPARYLVKETVLARTGRRYTESVRLSIHDRSAGKEMAQREVWRDDLGVNTKDHEGKDGWAGEKSAKFVRAVLGPDQVEWSSTCTRRYPETVFDLTISNLSYNITHDQLQNKNPNCNHIKVNERRNKYNGFLVESNDWAYRAGGGIGGSIHSVFCVDDNVFVFSGTYWHRLYIDWLSVDGILKGQFFVTDNRGAHSDKFDFEYIENTTIIDDKIFLRRIQTRELPKEGETTNNGTVADIIIDLKKSSLRYGWCNKIGEKTYYKQGEERCKNRISPPNPMVIVKK